MPSYKTLAITALAASFVSPALSAPIGSSRKQSRAEIAPHPLFLLPMVSGAGPPAPEPSGGGSKRATDAPESRAIVELEGHGEHGEAGEAAAMLKARALSTGKKVGLGVAGGGAALFGLHQYHKAQAQAQAQSAPPPGSPSMPPDSPSMPPGNPSIPPGNPSMPPGNPPPPGYNALPGNVPPSGYNALPGNVPPSGYNALSGNVPPSGYNALSAGPSPSSYTAPSGYSGPAGRSLKRDNAVILVPLPSKGSSGVHELGQRDVPSPEVVAALNALNQRADVPGPEVVAVLNAPNTLNQRADYTPGDVAPRPLGRALNELD